VGLGGLKPFFASTVRGLTTELAPASTRNGTSNNRNRHSFLHRYAREENLEITTPIETPPAFSENPLVIVVLVLFLEGCRLRRLVFRVNGKRKEKIVTASTRQGHC
jgi:hypothetical protein